jgi:antitoxin PrlF
MATLKSSKSLAGGRVRTVGVEYRGKQTRTGNSLGFRFEGALFKSHPEFNGEVRAHVIAPGQMLVSAMTPIYEESDPVLDAFLAFLAKDMEDHPEQIKPLSADLMERIERLTQGITVDPDEDLGDEALL